MARPDIKCPKCGSSALGTQKTELPMSAKRTYVSLHCLTCGARFNLVEEPKPE